MSKIVRTKCQTVNYRCPDTGEKRRRSFNTRAKAEAHREVLMAEFAGERYFNPNTNPTVREAAKSLARSKAWHHHPDGP